MTGDLLDPLWMMNRYWSRCGKTRSKAHVWSAGDVKCSKCGLPPGDLMEVIEKRVIGGKVSLVQNDPAGKLTITEMTNLTIVVVRVARTATIKLMASWIVAIDRREGRTSSIGVVLTIPKGYSGRCPAILTGLEASPQGTILPGGCTASFLEEYNGPISNLGSPDSFSIVIAFPSALAPSEIDKIVLVNPES